MSVPTSELEALRRDSGYTARYSQWTAVSHTLAYLVETQPLGSLLAKAVDGGEPINDMKLHPIRGPVFHEPDAVASLYGRITAEWKKIDDTSRSEGYFVYFGEQIDELIAIFRHAIAEGECIVSVMESNENKSRLRFQRIGDSKPNSDTGSEVPFSPLWFGISATVSLALALCVWRYCRCATNTSRLASKEECHSTRVESDSD